MIFAVIIELIRRGRLREHALLWLGTATVILLFGLWRDGLNEPADVLGIAYPPNALFVLALAFMLLLLLHYSTVISRLRPYDDAHAANRDPRGAPPELDSESSTAFARRQPSPGGK